MPPSIEPGPGGMITVEQAALLCGVRPVTVRNWITRGWKTPDGVVRKLPVAWRYKGRIMLEPREVAIADHASAARARRVSAATMGLPAA